MSTLERVPGAGLLVDHEYTITTGNARCRIVFKRDVEDIEGTDLQTLFEDGLLDDATLETWKQGVSAVLDDSTDEITEQITLTPAGSDEEYVYDLRITSAGDDQSNHTCCSLRSVGTSQRYDETITALHVATRELMTATDIEDVLHRTAVAANEVLGFPGTAVRKYDPRDGMLRHISFGARVTNIDSRPPYSVENSPHGRAIRRRETIIHDIEDDEDPYNRDVFTQTMYTPIGTVGLLSVGSVGKTFDETDVQFAEILTENAAAAIRVVDTTNSLREERERLELLRQILTRVLRHNIRNDMNVIKGHAEVLDNCVEPQNREFVENIIASVENVTSLSEKAREIEGIVEERQTRQRLDLDAVLERAIKRVCQQYPDATIDVNVGASYQVHAHASLDVALANLLENAYEHTDTSEPVVSVTPSDDAETVEIAVVDDGSGVPSSEIEVLEAKSETKLEHGSGLGLWIVSWVVEQSEGELSFETSNGTTARITLARATDLPE